MKQRVEVFISAAPEDENLFRLLVRHIEVLEHQGLISLWHNRKVGAGANRLQEVENHLQSAQVIILLLSPDFLTSNYDHDYEARRALELHTQGQKMIIPVLLRPFYWKSIPLGNFQVLPRNQRPVTDSSWHSVDEALLTIVQEIRDVLRTMSPEERLVHQPGQRPLDLSFHLAQPHKKSFSPKKVLGIILLIALLLSLGVGGSLLLYPKPLSQQERAIQQYTQATSGPPTISDTLDGQTRQQWDQNDDCNFVDGGYHVTGQQTYSQLAGCSFSGQFQDFAFQAQMTLLKGIGGGLLFRKTGNSFGYRFSLGPNSVDLTYDNSGLFSLSNGPKAQPNQAYLLAVLVKGNTIALYINNVWLDTVRDTDSTHTPSGSIGFMIYQPDGSTTEAVFRNAQLWEL